MANPKSTYRKPLNKMPRKVSALHQKSTRGSTHTKRIMQRSPAEARTGISGHGGNFGGSGNRQRYSSYPHSRASI